MNTAQNNNDGERGAVAGLSALQRVDRLHGLLHGLYATVHLLDDARAARDKIEGPCSEELWASSTMFIGERIQDCIHEVSALHAQTGELPRSEAARPTSSAPPADWILPLLKAQGVGTLLAGAVDQISPDAPMPEGVETGIMTMNGLVAEALAVGGY